jgi:predicted DCC family thiol-disulfide oxidoreductase YuxK
MTATVPVVRFTVKGRDLPEDALTWGSPGRPYTVVYDGYCKVCKRLVAMLKKWDRHHDLEILPSQTAGIGARFPWIPARAYLESVQFIDHRTETTWQGAAALEHIIDVLPKGKLITWIFSIPFVRPLAEKFYRWFARNRYRLGCGEHCQLREPLLEFDEQGS